MKFKVGDLVIGNITGIPSLGIVKNHTSNGGYIVGFYYTEEHKHNWYLNIEGYVNLYRKESEIRLQTKLDKVLK